MWARLVQDNAEGKEQPKGGPRKWEAQSVSQTSHDFRRGSFSPLPPSSPYSPLMPRSRQQGTTERRQGGRHHDTNRGWTIPRAKRRHGGPHDQRAGPRTTRAAQGRHGGRKDDATARARRRRAQRRCEEPNDDTNSPSTARWAEGGPEQPKDDTAGWRAT